MHGTYAKSFSIRSLLFVTFIVGAFLAAFRDPSDEMVLCIVATLITSVAAAWYVSLRDWPDGNRWLFAFAIAQTEFSESAVGDEMVAIEPSTIAIVNESTTSLDNHWSV